MKYLNQKKGTDIKVISEMYKDPKNRNKWVALIIIVLLFLAPTVPTVFITNWILKIYSASTTIISGLFGHLIFIGILMTFIYIVIKLIHKIID